MRKLFYFLLRWLYRLFWLLAAVFTVAMVMDEAVSLSIKAAAVVLVLLLWTVPEYFPNVFPKRRRREMTGRDFEHLCAAYLRKKKFRRIRVTPASGDYGADLVAWDRRRHKWVFQCKYYTGKVGNSAVQEAVAAKAHYGAERAAVMTNSQLTRKARELAADNEVVLYENIGK